MENIDQDSLEIARLALELELARIDLEPYKALHGSPRASLETHMQGLDDWRKLQHDYSEYPRQ